MKTNWKPRKSGGFSLVEISLAIAVIASVLISLMLVMGMASSAAAKATRLTTIGHIFTDAHQRMEGNPLRDGQLRDAPYYYDGEGVFISQDDSRELQLSRVYRVDIVISTPAPNVAKNAEGLKAVTMEIAWPVNGADGSLLGYSANNRESMTYFVTALTGPNWEKVDPTFDPTIEL